MIRKVVFGSVAVVVVGGGVLLGSGFLHLPPELGSVAVTCPFDTPVMPIDQPVTVLVWNVQYGAGRSYHFFYSGGSDVHVAPEDVEATLDGLAAVVADVDPDIVLWQEIDRASARTGLVDQHAELLRRVPYPCHVSTPYHRAGYVPHPPQEHMGRVDMHLSVFSRYRLTDGLRHQLPLLDEPWWRRLFNLRRAILDVGVETAGGPELRLLDTHLSAFSMGDGTLRRQMDAIDTRLADLDQTPSRWLLGGDFNALPPGDDPSRLGADAVAYDGPGNSIAKLFARHRSAVPAEAYTADPQRWRTWLPGTSNTPDRTLDYVFVGPGVFVEEVEVLHVPSLSDHLPLKVVIKLSEG